MSMVVEGTWGPAEGFQPQAPIFSAVIFGFTSAYYPSAWSITSYALRMMVLQDFPSSLVGWYACILSADAYLQF